MKKWLLTALLLAQPSFATPFVPTSDSQVLERLRLTPQTKTLRRQLTQSPQDLKLAVQLARSYIEQGRIEADPRFNGRAEAVLAPWWNQPQPPPVVLVLRATLRQSNHDFPRALADLDQVLKTDPYSGQAWITKATILQVQGQYPEAKSNCMRLWRMASDLVTVTCLASIASLNGQAQSSLTLLNRLVEQSPQATTGEKQWALTELAEVATRLNQPRLAEKYFQQALALGPDSYLLGAYADFLLDQKRPAQVIALLKDQTRADGLLLRLALAEQALSLALGSTHRQILADRFAASRLRGDTVHRREEARFALHLAGDPALALTLAQANWAIQREPADARILLESALANRNKAAAQPVLTWLKTNKLEDPYLRQLQQRLGALT